MGIVTDKNITFFDSLDDISIYRLDKCLQGHLKYLITSYEYGVIKELPEGINDAWDVLYNEWCKLTVSLDSMRMYSLRLEINYLYNMLLFVPTLLNTFIKDGQNKKVKEELKAWGYSFNDNHDYLDQLDRMAAQLRATESKYNLKLEEYSDLSKSDTKALTLQEQKVKLERALGVSIRLKRTSATEWLAYCKEIETLKKPKRR